MPERRNLAGMKDVPKSWQELSVMRRTPRSSGLIVLAAAVALAVVVGSAQTRPARRWTSMSSTWRAETPRFSSRRPANLCSSIPEMPVQPRFGMRSASWLPSKTRTHPDRPSDYHSLARRSFWRHGGARRAHPDPDFIDHGPNVQPAAAADEFLQKTYPQLYAKAKHAVQNRATRFPSLAWMYSS